jgi:hypothetical protein
MEGLNIVELGKVSEETRGTLIIGIPDPSGHHYYWIPNVTARPRNTVDVSSARDDKVNHGADIRDRIR